MNEHENKMLIRRWLEAADGGFPSDFGSFFVSDYRGHLSGRIHMDLEELVRLERGFAAGFTDVKRAIDDLLAVEDKVVLRLTTTAMHAGEWQGIAPTGRRITFTGMVIYRIENGRIAESWGELDFGSLWRQVTAPSQPT